MGRDAAEIVEDAADRGVTLGVEVDQDGTPVVVTEDVQNVAAMTRINDAHEAATGTVPVKPKPKGKG